MKKKVPWISADQFNLRLFRDDPNRAIAYLNAAVEVAFKEDDPELILTSLAIVAKAFGIEKVAKDANLRRESLHRMLSRRGNPEWRSIFRVFRALHIRPKLESTAIAAV